MLLASTALVVVLPPNDRPGQRIGDFGRQYFANVFNFDVADALAGTGLLLFGRVFTQ